MDAPLDYRKIKSSPSRSAAVEQCVLRTTLTNTYENESITTDTSPIPPSLLECRLHHPSIKVRRLWAPHAGLLRIPHPPKLIADWYVLLIISVFEV